jgi:hypothetical protein
MKLLQVARAFGKTPPINKFFDSFEFIEIDAETGIGTQVALQLICPEICKVILQANGFIKARDPYS